MYIVSRHMHVMSYPHGDLGPDLISNQQSASDLIIRSYFDIDIDKMPWLMKAEPDSRVVKGKDIKVSYIDRCTLRYKRVELSKVLSGRFRRDGVSPNSRSVR
jgi:hypothetical protein